MTVIRPNLGFWCVHWRHAIFNGSVFCFVRVFFALNIYIYRTVASAAHVFCGVDIQQKGEQGCSSRLVSLSINMTIVLSIN